MKVIYFLIPLILGVSNAYAYRANFEWAKNPESTDGYILYFSDGDQPKPPFDCKVLNDGQPKVITKEEAHKYSTNGRMYIDGLNPSKTYNFALTAYEEEACWDNPYTDTDESLNTKYRTDGTAYCESDYSDIVYVGTQPIPTIDAIYINL